MTELEARTICIDIDGVVCDSGPTLDYSGSPPIPGAVEALAELRRAGFVIVLCTARHFNHWQTTVNWLDRHAIAYDQLVFGKPPARWYVDDRAVHFNGDWGVVRMRLMKGREGEPLAAT